MAAVCAVYLALSGQFFDYHWMPFQQFALCIAALVLIEPFILSSEEHAPCWFGTLVLTVAAVLALRPAPELIDQLRDRHVSAPEQGRAEQIATFLQAKLRPGDTVQPLDWVNGAVHGMLIARAPIATRFVDEYQFFHDVDTDEIRGLRREFIDALNATQPRYIIDVYAGRPYVTDHGPQTHSPSWTLSSPPTIERCSPATASSSTNE